MSNRPATSPANSSCPRILGVVCLVLLITIATLLAHIITLRGEIDAQATQAAVANQQLRDLQQQLEAERLLAATQSRMLRTALGVHLSPPLEPTPPALPPPTSAQP